MKRKVLFNLGLIALVAFLTYAVSLGLFRSMPDTDEAIQSLGPGMTAPDFTVTTYDDRNVKLDDLSGRLVLLNFWASWCAPCKKEFPMLLDIAQQYPDRVALIALSSDINQNAMEKFIEDMAQQHPETLQAPNVYIAWDENQHITGNVYGTFKLPETFVIGPEARILDKKIGADWGLQDIKRFIAE